VSVGPDIKEVLSEIGSPFTIIRESTISGEYLRHKPNKQAIKPFVLEYFLETEIAYDSAVLPGDIINITSLNADFLVIHKQGSDLEGEIYKYDCILYKSNVSGELQRPTVTEMSGETYSQTYQEVTTWNTIKSSAYGLLTESLFGNELNEQDFAQLSLVRDELYLPSSYGIQVNDRYSPKSGEYLKVTSVKRRTYSRVDVVTVEEDTRQ
jgi:hypothetical protein